MSSGVFRRSLSSDIECHLLKFVDILDVFTLHAVSVSARDSLRRAFVRCPWDVVLTCNAPENAYRALERFCDANAYIRSVSLVSSMRLFIVHYTCSFIDFCQLRFVLEI